MEIGHELQRTYHSINLVFQLYQCFGIRTSISKNERSNGYDWHTRRKCEKVRRNERDNHDTLNEMDKVIYQNHYFQFL